MAQIKLKRGLVKHQLPGMLEVFIYFLSFLLYELPSADSADAHELKLRYNLIVISTIVYIGVRALSGLWWACCSRTTTTAVKAFEEELATALAEQLQKDPTKLLMIAEHAASEVVRRQQIQGNKPA